MKRLSLAFLVVGMTTLWAAPRMVVGELFTNTSCGPCWAANLKLDAIAQQDSSFLAVIRYHTWWPGQYDPFYQANISENRSRTNYYGTNYVPHFYIDGIMDGGSNSAAWAGMINSRADVPAPLSIELWRNYDDSTRQGAIIIQLRNESEDSISGMLHCVLTETGILYNAPNYLVTHNQTMLDMTIGSYGELVSIPAGDSFRKEHSFWVKDTIWLNPPGNTIAHLVDPDSCELVVFLQNHSTREIYQGAKVWVVPGVSLEFAGHTVDDSGGNNDHKLNPDETAALLVTITNQKGNTHNVKGILRCEDSYVMLLDSVSVFGDIGAGEDKDNSDDPFTIQVSDAAPDSHPVDFSLFFTSADRYFTEFQFQDTIYWLPPGVAELPKKTPTTLQIYPSPFNEPLAISYQLSTPAQVDLKIYDPAGRCIKTLISSQTLEPGAYSLKWNGRDDGGRRVAPGVYFCRLRVGAESLTQKAVITR